MPGLSRDSQLLNPDFLDILSIFLEESVEFLVIGAYAVAAHGLPRATKDIDLWVACSAQNAAHIVTALQRFGAPLSSIGEPDFLRPGITFQIGVAPRRIDIVTEIAGIRFEEAYPILRLHRTGSDTTAQYCNRSSFLAVRKCHFRPYRQTLCRPMKPNAKAPDILGQ